jgi:GNAT superfamily N-acetyltransferase
MIPTIRKATPEDAPSILKHLQESYVSAYSKNQMFTVNDEDASSTIAAAIEGKGACALVATDDKGALLALAIGVLSPQLLNFAFQMAVTLAFWVAPAQRKTGLGTKLAEELEAWAKDAGAGAFVLGHTRGPFDSAMGRLCKRRGMVPGEAVYVKKLGVS